MATFKSNCPHCQSELELETDWIGMEAECPECMNPFTVTAPAAPQRRLNRPPQRPVPQQMPPPPPQFQGYPPQMPPPQYPGYPPQMPPQQFQGYPPQYPGYPPQMPPQYPGYPPVPYGPNPYSFIPSTQYKSWGLVTFLNLLCPGFGHFYLGMIGKGFIFLLIMAGIMVGAGACVIQAEAYYDLYRYPSYSYDYDYYGYSYQSTRQNNSGYLSMAKDYMNYAKIIGFAFFLVYAYIAGDALYAFGKSASGEPVRRWEFRNPFGGHRYITCKAASIITILCLLLGITGPGIAAWIYVITEILG